MRKGLLVVDNYFSDWSLSQEKILWPRWL